jgi:hypothetical protein
MGSGGSSQATFDADHPFCVQAAASSNAAGPAAVYCRGTNQAQALATATAAHAMCVAFNSPTTTGATDGAYTCPAFTRFDNQAGPNLAPIALAGAKGSFPLAGLASSTQYVDVGTAGAKPMSIYPVPSTMECTGKSGTVTAMPLTFGADNFCNIHPTKKKT